MKSSIIFATLMVLSSACQSTRSQDDVDSLKAEDSATKPAPVLKPSYQALKQLQALSFSHNEVQTHPGQAVLIEFPYHGPFAEEQLLCRGRGVPFFKSSAEGKAYAVWSESYFADLEDGSCEFSFFDAHGDQKTRLEPVALLNINSYAYPEETLNVDRKRVFLSPEDEKRVEREQEIFEKIYAESATTPYFAEPFASPLNSKITSKFGSKRLFNNAKQTQHLGTDLRAAIGTKIKVSQRGKVVFAADTFYGGNTVVVDHGVGVFSIYAHLSAFKSKVGQIVEKNQVIGLSGMTGRVNGPHLHWGFKVQGNDVDGFSVVALSKELHLR